MTGKLSKSLKHRVKNATVRMCDPTREAGQGVYLGEEMILTAAHCLQSLNIWKITIAPGQKYLEKLQTHDGKKLEVMVFSADVVKDVAVLMPWEEADDDAFGDFCEDTEPVPLCSSDFLKEYAGVRTDDGGFREFQIHVFTHEDEFTTCKASICHPTARAVG